MVLRHGTRGASRKSIGMCMGLISARVKRSVAGLHYSLAQCGCNGGTAMASNKNRKATARKPLKHKALSPVKPLKEFPPVPCGKL